jgi:hypothetical protein
VYKVKEKPSSKTCRKQTKRRRGKNAVDLKQKRRKREIKKRAGKKENAREETKRAILEGLTD